MPAEKMNWDNVETWQRVLAAVIATGVKVDLKATAKYYGTTYDTLENKFRKIKKTAAELRDEVESGQRGEIVRCRSAPSTPRKQQSPTKGALSTVANGRISKGTPSKRRIKQEVVLDHASSIYEDSSSFDAMTSFGVDPTLSSFNTEDYDFLKGIQLGDPVMSFDS